MDDGKLRIAIAAGGTAGHVNPALALAEELRDRGHHVVFYGNPAKLEATLVPEAGFEFFGIDVTGFDRSRPWTLLTAAWLVLAAQRRIAAHMKAEGAPDAAIGFGAYVEVPLLRHCASKNIPTLIHEQNSVPGLANKLCASTANSVCVAFPAATEAFASAAAKGARIFVVGNPVRSSVLAGDRERGRAAIGATPDETVLLVFGGSLGAKSINEFMASMKGRLLGMEKLRIVQSTGATTHDETVEALALDESEAKRWQILEYIDDMGDKLAAADLVLSRAGASSVAEIAALAVPSVLVPYPFATADHQTANAHLLADAGAAIICPDAELTAESFGDELVALLGDGERLAAMRAAAGSLDAARAAALLADQVEMAARGR